MKNIFQISAFYAIAAVSVVLEMMLSRWFWVIPMILYAVIWNPTLLPIVCTIVVILMCAQAFWPWLKSLTKFQWSIVLFLAALFTAALELALFQSLDGCRMLLVGLRMVAGAVPVLILLTVVGMVVGAATLSSTDPIDTPPPDRFRLTRQVWDSLQEKPKGSWYDVDDFGFTWNDAKRMILGGLLSWFTVPYDLVRQILIVPIQNIPMAVVFGSALAFYIIGWWALLTVPVGWIGFVFASRITANLKDLEADGTVKGAMTPPSWTDEEGLAPIPFFVSAAGVFLWFVVAGWIIVKAGVWVTELIVFAAILLLIFTLCVFCPQET